LINLGEGFEERKGEELSVEQEGKTISRPVPTSPEVREEKELCKKKDGWREQKQSGAEARSSGAQRGQEIDELGPATGARNLGAIGG